MSSARAERDHRVRIPACEGGARDLGVGRADDRDLLARREVEVERDERPAEGRRDLGERAHDQPEHRDRALLEQVVAVDAGEPQQDVGEHRVPARRRMVVEALLARDELLAVRRRLEEAAVLLVEEELEREPREPVRLLEPAQLAGRDVQLEQPVRDVGVVLEVARSLGDAVAPGAVQPALGRRERPEQELRQAPGGLDPVRPVESAAALGQRREREPVPRRDAPCRRGPAWAAARAARRAPPASPRRARRGGRTGSPRRGAAARRGRPPSASR